MDQQLEILPKNEKKEYMCEGVVVLTSDLSVPEVQGIGAKAGARLSRYYGLMLSEAARYAEKHLFPAASEAFRRALGEGRLMAPYALKLRYTVTQAKPDGALSLYTDMTERAGNETVILRRADTFSVADGYPVPPIGRRAKKKAARRCARMVKDGAVKGITGSVRRHLRRDRCCLTSEGFLVFFPPGEVASVETGVVELALPPESELLKKRKG